jgi:hypothetical protein
MTVILADLVFITFILDALRMNFGVGNACRLKGSFKAGFLWVLSRYHLSDLTLAYRA